MTGTEQETERDVSLGELERTQRLIDAAVLVERENCARFIEKHPFTWPEWPDLPDSMQQPNSMQQLAAEIREGEHNNADG